MKKQTHNKDRRAILKGLAVIPVLAITGLQSTAYAAMVSADDPTAKALAYTDKSTTEGKSCGNCNLYQGGSAAAGGCPIFPGKDVAAAGWCKSWVAKA
ncbi:MAG: high-potential iron-sulfur protein [Gammaproteobacteria bacterium]|nr:high-potential iron-sulfur protein [Gammaproteobacteria bacterium]